MQDTYLVLWKNKERINLVDAYKQSPEIIRAIYWTWCWNTFNSKAIQKKYGINVRHLQSNADVTNPSLNYSYEFKPENNDAKEIEFEEFLFKEGLRPSDQDDEEGHYYKGLLREWMGVRYDATGKLEHTEWKSTRTIGELTGINYVTVSKDLKEGIKYIYKEWDK